MTDFQTFMREGTLDSPNGRREKSHRKAASTADIERMTRHYADSSVS